MRRFLLPLFIMASACLKPEDRGRLFLLPQDDTGNILQKWHAQGYLEAFCGDTLQQNGSMKLKCFRGPLYRADSVLIRSDSAYGFWKENLRSIVSGQRLSETDLLCSRALKLAQEAGYPFARLDRKLLHPFDKRYTLLIQAYSGEQFFWDSLMFSGTPAPDSRWLMRAVGAAPGTSWTPLDPKIIKTRINLMGPFRWQGDPLLTFAGNKAGIFIPAEELPGNQLMLLAGIGNRAGSGKPVLTGEARLHLEHLFSREWMIHAAWRSFNGSSQDLQMRMRAPFPAGLPLVAEGSLQAVRVDSSFASISPSLSASWLWHRVELRAELEQQNHIQQSLDTAFIISTRSLPDNLGCKVNFYTLGMKLLTMDHPFNPSRGVDMQIDASAGTKSIKRNPAVENLSTTHPGLNLYDSLEQEGRMRSNPFRIRAGLKAAIPLKGSFSLYTALQGQYLQDRLSSLAQADRLGGFSNLRGFNEQRIFANSWLMSTLELRYLMTERTYASLFWNGARTRLNTAEVSGVRRGFSGFGISAGFETKPGILQITWALGQEQGQQLSLRDAKIHAGLINRF